MAPPPQQFRHGTGGVGNILQATVTAHKTFGATDLMSTYSTCTREWLSYSVTEPNVPGSNLHWFSWLNFETTQPSRSRSGAIYPPQEQP
ncbi:hypothetical protein TNCV_3872961 [Trichonephila clavipes]|nr:hypothetical protein TNCV_3872961 [Trichonephila clavipes]